MKALISAGGIAAAMVLVAGAAQAQTALPAGQVGVPYSQSVTPTPPIPNSSTVTVGSLPAGLSVAAGGVGGTVSGTPTVAGNYSFTIATNYSFPVFPPSSGTVTTAYTLTIDPAPSAVPTLSEWAMILFGTGLAVGAALLIERRRRLV